MAKLGKNHARKRNHYSKRIHSRTNEALKAKLQRAVESTDQCIIQCMVLVQVIDEKLKKHNASAKEQLVSFDKLLSDLDEYRKGSSQLLSVDSSPASVGSLKIWTEFYSNYIYKEVALAKAVDSTSALTWSVISSAVSKIESSLNHIYRSGKGSTAADVIQAVVKDIGSLIPGVSFALVVLNIPKAFTQGDRRNENINDDLNDLDAFSDACLNWCVISRILIDRFEGKLNEIQSADDLPDGYSDGISDWINNLIDSID